MRARDRVLDSAIETLNHDPTASIEVIATNAGISRATLHRNFERRDDLLKAVGARAIDQWEADLAESGIEDAVASGTPADFAGAFDALLRVYLQSAQSHSFALTEPSLAADPQLSSRVQALNVRESAFLARGQALGVLRDDVSPDWIGCMVYGVLVAASEATKQGMVATRDTPDLMLSAFFEGMRSR